MCLMYGISYEEVFSEVRNPCVVYLAEEPRVSLDALDYAIRESRNIASNSNNPCPPAHDTNKRTIVRLRFIFAFILNLAFVLAFDLAFVLAFILAFILAFGLPFILAYVLALFLLTFLLSFLLTILLLFLLSFLLVFLFLFLGRNKQRWRRV